MEVFTYDPTITDPGTNDIETQTFTYNPVRQEYYYSCYNYGKTWAVPADKLHSTSSQWTELTQCTGAYTGQIGVSPDGQYLKLRPSSSWRRQETRENRIPVKRREDRRNKTQHRGLP